MEYIVNPNANNNGGQCPGKCWTKCPADGIIPCHDQVVALYGVVIGG